VVTLNDIAHDADLFRRHAPHWPHPEPEEALMTTASETTAPVAYGCCGHCDHDILVPLTMPPHTRACLHEGCTAGQSAASAPKGA
jgi:hypothetical protein